MRTLYIDGGGTKTASYLVENKKIIYEKISNAANINTDYEGSKKTILDILNFYKKYNFDKLIIGLAGANSNKNNKQKIEKILTKFNINFDFYSDLELFTKLIHDKYKINSFNVLNLGTGTAAIKYWNKKITTYLGWGKIIGDIGSGYDIGLNFIKFCAECEDKKIKNKYHKLFLKENDISSIREYIPLMKDIKNISKISLWINDQGSQAIKMFIFPRIDEVLNYLSFLKIKNLFCTGSILIKNQDAQKYLSKKLKNVNIKFVEFKNCLV